MSDDKGIGLKGWLAGQKSKSPPAAIKPEAISLAKRRVAVLPLANFTSDPGDEYFADGMTEELISTLSNISGLRVISRTSVMQYKNTGKKIDEIGRDLGAGSIIEGSVRKVGNQVRITVQLIDAQEDEHLWAQTYDRELKDVFAMQSDIARNVSDTLKVKLLPRETAQLQKIPTPSMDAYSLYLKGRFHWNKRSQESTEKAIEYFQDAINQDPNYALAYAGLADCYNVASSWNYLPEKDALARAEKAARKALELDSSLAEAHAALAMTLEADWKWEAAESEYKRAIELNPNYASARQWHSTLLSALGRMEEALTEIKKASETDPLSPIITTHMGIRLQEMGEYDRSVEQFKKALETQPDFSFARTCLAEVYAKKSMLEEALAEFQRIGPGVRPLYVKLDLAWAYAVCGRRNEAEKILRDEAKSLGPDSAFLVNAAYVYSALGNIDKAMELLQRAYESHTAKIEAMGDMAFDNPNLAADPRFIELLKKIGLRK